MIALIQRVVSAKVVISNENIAEINKGILMFLGIEKSDDDKEIVRLITKVLNYRIFPDTSEKMNLSLLDCNYDLLIVPQFTLVANTKKGNRPSFSNAMHPKDSVKIFNNAIKVARDYNINVQCGKFQSDMKVHLINDGPVTFIL